MKKLSSRQKTAIAIAIALFGAASIVAVAGMGADDGAPAAANETATDNAGQASVAAAALTVTMIRPELSDWPFTVAANGSVAPWQETVIGSELSGLRLVEVAVNVGDVVRKGQVLARFAREGITAENAQEEASVEVQRAALAEAKANAERARTLAANKMMSAQQASQLITAERTASANLNLALARLQSQRIRLGQTVVRAPDDGAISARDATVGAVVAQGQQLFKLIRQGRLEWRAEVAADVLPQIQPGQVARLTLANGTALEGRVRVKAPTVNPDTLNAVVYVDLPHSPQVSAGMFAAGQFELGRSNALTVPQSAVVIRDGSAYVYQLGAGNKVAQTQVTLGRRIGDRVEVLRGLRRDTQLVARGAGLLADGDVVNVLTATKGART